MYKAQYRRNYLKCFRLTIASILFISIQACNSQINLIEDVEKTLVEETLRYYLYYPSDYFEKEDQDFPLLLFLHGGGEAGGELEHLKIHGPPKMIVEGKQFPFLILAPQHPHPKKFWNTSAVMNLLDSVIVRNRVDKSRIYLTGLSRGGTASWELVTQYPDRFAAMAVVCGRTPLPYASWINKELAMWVFHGEEDPVIRVEESEMMVEKLERMGYDIKFTRYPGVGHDAWTRAYQNDSLYSWFVQYKLKD